MKLSTKSKEYFIPEYSLTGDLLSFLTCNLQYRYQNKGNLPPSMPIQLWFGEFIHGALEEAYLRWKNLPEDEKSDFPWIWEDKIRPIEELITDRLKVKGLNPPAKYFEDEGPQNNMYSARLYNAINIWGKDLFPLIDDTEVLIKGLRQVDGEEFISDYYSINGVVDVLSSEKINVETKRINECSQQTLDQYLNKSNENEILNYLSRNIESKKLLDNQSEEYEIIIDYKGMRRPSAPSQDERAKIQSMMANGCLFESDEYKKYKIWIQHEWQILTYAWLRKRQNNSQKPIIGIIFYLNELVPSSQDLLAIKDDLINNQTDISKDMLKKEDLKILMNWDGKEEDIPIHRDLSSKFKKDRSIRIINIDEELFENSLKQFDNVVRDIESSLIKEMNGVKIKDAWKAEAEERTCSACDFRTFCDKKNCGDSQKQEFTIP